MTGIAPEKGYQGAMAPINKGAGLLPDVTDTSGHGYPGC
jgi:hypothetical protein